MFSYITFIICIKLGVSKEWVYIHMFPLNFELFVHFSTSNQTSINLRHSFYTYLDTWSGFEAAKTAPWPSRGLHHFGKFLGSSDEWAGRGCCFNLMRWHVVGHFWLIRNELQRLVELKFEFYSFNTFDVSHIFWERVVQPKPKYM